MSKLQLFLYLLDYDQRMHPFIYIPFHSKSLAVALYHLAVPVINDMLCKVTVRFNLPHHCHGKCLN